MRRLRLPLLSTLVMRNGRDWPVFDRCVPPHAWRSTPSMSMIRSCPSGVGGGATDRLRTSPATVAGVAGVDVHAAHVDAAADHVVDAGVEAAQHVVVDLRQVEVHPPGAVGVDLGAGDERAGEAVVDEGVEDVRVGVQLGDARAVVGVDAHDDRRRLGSTAVVEQVPHDVVDGLDADDRRPCRRRGRASRRR